MTFLLANWRLVLVAALCAAIGIQTWRLNSCQQEFNDFRISVEALGRAQEAETARIIAEREKAAKEAQNALQTRLDSLSTKYAAARKRLRDNPGGGSVPTEPAAPALASACESPDRLVERLGELEAALLDALERGDQELVKFRELWTWINAVR